MSLDGSFNAARGGDLFRGRSSRASLEKVQDRIGRALRHRRRTLDLTLREVGDRCGVSFQQIQKYESGTNTISAAQLWSLSQALSVPVSYFFEGAEGL